MSDVPHELHEEFPDAVQKIREMKMSNPHFVELADAYHLVNREIHRMETGIEPVSEDSERQKRRQRLALEDRIALYLRA
jgi:uncharacterized protein YdcH (DUF465 family)